jgi:hypothetical protein
MLMLSHAHEVSRHDLAAIPTPDPTNTWRPAPHVAVVETLTERARSRGLRITAERYAVMDGTLYPRPGMQVALRGARLFGSLDFEPIPGIPFPPGCRPSAGLRNSHDKSFALSILAGSRVLVCANGLLLAEHVINRKHTSGLSLRLEVDKALDAFLQTLADFHRIHGMLVAARLTKVRAHHLVVEMARAGAFSSSDILKVVHEWEEPRHPEFRERNAWTLHQAASEMMKAQSPARQVDGFKALSGVMLAAVN